VRILGIDGSLTATGLASVEGVRTLKPPKNMRGAERLSWFGNEIRDLSDETDVAIVEGYSFASKAAREVLGELGGIIRVELYRANVPFVVVQPKSVKKFATGVGNAGKDEVIAAAIRRWGFEGVSNNEADAWMLYLMGVYHYNISGRSGGSGDYRALTKAEQQVLDQVEWPALELID
jgi:crossover junction endodeoxyribonuclease RuvC